MHALTSALYDALTSDPELGRLLPGYDGAPAVFTGRFVPQRAPFPRVLVRPPASEVGFNTMDTKGWEILQDVAIHAEDTGSEEHVSLLAERIRDVLDWDKTQVPFPPPPVAVPGWAVVEMRATKADLPPDEVEFTGRLVSLRVLLQQDIA